MPTENPLRDCKFQITWIEGHSSALLSVRGKDHPLTIEDLRKIAKSANFIADLMEKKL